MNFELPRRARACLCLLNVTKIENELDGPNNCHDVMFQIINILFNL
jgi:hypothetical protein